MSTCPAESLGFGTSINSICSGDFKTSAFTESLHVAVNKTDFGFVVQLLFTTLIFPTGATPAGTHRILQLLFAHIRRRIRHS